MICFNIRPLFCYYYSVFINMSYININFVKDNGTNDNARCGTNNDNGIKMQ